MRQLDLVKAFVDGATEGDALSLHIRGDQLVHYNTAILERHEDNFILNYTRYSLATGKVQKMITDTIDGAFSSTCLACRQTLAARWPIFLNQKTVGTKQSQTDISWRSSTALSDMGYVTDIMPGLIECQFGKQTKTLMYPQTIESGIVNIIADYREEQGG